MRGSTYTPEISRANAIDPKRAERTAKINTESTYAILNRLQGQIDSLRRTSKLALLIDGSNEMLADLHLNGFNLDLDVDRDTYLGTDGDDHVELVMSGPSGQFDITINGADDFTFTANSMNVLAGSVINIAAGTAQITFGDGDSYIYERVDDIVAVVLAGAAGELEININGAEDFNFQANTLNVLVGSHIEMGDDTWIGFTAGGQLVWDSTPGVDEIRVVAANLDLNGNDLIMDADGDSYFHASADNVVDLVLAGAAGEFGITINGAEDFTFTANTFNVLSGSSILMADDTWIGLGAAIGRLYFDSSPTPNEMRLVLMNLDLNNNDIVFDVNGDTYIHSTADDVVALVLATAAGEFDININSAIDFSFQENVFNVLAGSHIEMGDDTWMGFTAGGQLVWDSTPVVDEIRVETANLDLNNNDLIMDADGDTYLHSSTDDVVALVLATAAGKFRINIDGVGDFNFEANTFNVLAGSHIEMGDDTWVGFTAGAQIVFDSTPATDLISLNSCTVTFGSYGLGIIHSSAGGALTSSAVVNGDLGNLGMAGKLVKFGVTGLADSLFTETADAITLASSKYLFLSATAGTAYDGLFIGDVVGGTIYAGLQALQAGGSNYLYFANGRKYSFVTGWADMTGGILPGGMFLVLGNTFNFSSFAIGSLVPVERMSVNSSGYFGLNVVGAVQESPIQYGNRYSSDVVDSPAPIFNIIGDPVDNTPQKMLRLMRKGRIDSRIQVNATADFNLSTWGPGGAGDLYRGRAKLDINLKNDTVTYDWTETADEIILSLYSDGRVAMPTDSANFLIGAGLDAGIQYDGTNLLITPDLVGTGKVIINTAQAVALTIGKGSAGIDYQLTFDGETNDGVLTWMEDEDYFRFDDDLFINKSMYKDINLAGALLSKPASSYPGTDTFRTSTPTDTGIETYAFAVGEKVHGGFELQHDYKEGTNLVFHVHFQIIDAPTGTDNVQWRLTYIVTRDGITVTTVTTIDSPDTAVDTRYRVYRSDFSAITGTNFKIGDQFMFTLERVSATGDDFAGDALIETAGIHYEVDTFGSRQIATK